MQKIKLVHLIIGLGIGGAEKVVFDLSRFANQEAFDVSVLVLGEENGMLPFFRKNNIPVEFLHADKLSFKPFRMLYSLWQGIQKIRAINKASEINVIHAHMSYAGILATIAKMVLPKTKIVFTSHNFNLESKLDEKLLFLTKKIRNVDIIFSKEMHKDTYRKDAVVIPNGIMTSEYELNTAKFNPFTFICIGRLGEQKNQIALIPPVKKLVEKGYNFQLLLVGEGLGRASLEKAIQQNNLQETIKLLGIRNDISELCNQAHCLVMPSLWEGFPIVLLEAGASKLPIITTNVGSIRHLINKEELGYLIPDNTTLSNQMEEVLNNYDLAKQKGLNLKMKVKKQFDIHQIVKQHESLYSKLAINH